MCLLATVYTAYNHFCCAVCYRQYAAKFAGFGVTVDPQDIVTSGSALADYLKEQGITCAYVVGESLLNTDFKYALMHSKMQSQYSYACLQTTKLGLLGVQRCVAAVVELLTLWLHVSTVSVQ
jgi:ribonucleotide monophosphatase NagD (HAD superfamily)